MATYKVIQDIEAEDKLLGPLSLRQFIYAVICVGMLFICYMLVLRAGTVGLLFTPLFLAPAAFFGFLAFPFSREQSTELWALSRMNFLFNPRKRTWNQSGVRDLVTVTAPQKVEHSYTNGLTQTEVKSRLEALAQTLDSRGWAVTNTNQTYINPLETNTNPDRLLDATPVTQEVANEIYADAFDPSTGGVGQHFDDMLRVSGEEKRAALIKQMQAPATDPQQQAPPPTPPQDFWFMNQTQPPADTPADNVMFSTQVVNPGADDDDNIVPVPNEGELLDELKAHENLQPKAYNHLPTIQPLDVQRKQAAQRQQELARSQSLAAEHEAVNAARAAATAAYDNGAAEPAVVDNAAPAPTVDPPKPVTATQNAAILDFVNNDDLDLATISRQLNRPHQNDDGSVEISLH